MTFPEFIKGMKDHFGITDGVNKYLDPFYLLYKKEVKINIIMLDKWLYEQHGRYDKDVPKSMGKFIEEKYSQSAADFVSSLL